MPKKKSEKPPQVINFPAKNEPAREDVLELAAKIDYLFENYRKSNGEKYTLEEVSKAAGSEFSESWLSKLRNGQGVRPGLKVITALTRVFGVDPGFWFKSLNEWIKDKEEAELNGDALYNRIALRTKNLPPLAQTLIEDVITSYEKRFKETE